eukprot:TRINITY_DN57484_c0_g1_i1.p1 TRINITY_DN57484_c0_g1~~TRINITY_DN57484_c0_g1_i1.p1  ORF type:complete len:328 (+),score=63.37 TRINITY_DN57484_c0_g1_i1:40-1023(+)
MAGMKLPSLPTQGSPYASARQKETPQAYGLAENPFDKPSNLMNTLDKALAELRASVRAEQQNREEDVGRLQQEVLRLQEALASERSERLEGCTILGRNLITQDEKSTCRIQDQGTHFAGRLQEHEGTFSSDLLKSNSRISDLASEIREEAQAWRAASTEMEKRIELNAVGDNQFAHETSQTIMDHQQQISSLRSSLELVTEDVVALKAKASELSNALSQESNERSSQCMALERARVAGLADVGAELEEFRVATGAALGRQRKEVMTEIVELRSRTTRVEEDVVDERVQRRGTMENLTVRLEADEADILKLLRCTRFSPSPKVPVRLP